MTNIEKCMEMLRHTLGVDIKRKHWGYRNRYVVYNSNEINPDIAEMLEEGYIEVGLSSDNMTLYIATEKACKLLGFTDAEIKNAMDF